MTFEELLHPFNAGVFIADFLERKPLHIPRPWPAFCSRLPGVDDLDELVLLTMADRGGLRMARTEGKAKQELEVDPRLGATAQLTEFYRRYADGWTLIVNSVHQRCGAVAQLAAALGDALAQRVIINLYFTPPNAQGFALHADGHDVFLLQLTGRKRWRVFHPSVPLPLEDQDVPIDADNPGACVYDVMVEPGHVLYIPRGYTHEGFAGDRASLHLTIGIHPFRWVDVVTEAVAVAAERDVKMRESLPIGALTRGTFRPDLEDKLTGLLRALSEAGVAGETLSRVSRKRVVQSYPAPHGHFAAIDRARHLELDTRVQHRPGTDCMVRREGNYAVIQIGSNQVAGPAAIEPALRFVTANRGFLVRELPDELSDDSKIVLARRLVKEGLLTTIGNNHEKETSRHGQEQG